MAWDHHAQGLRLNVTKQIQVDTCGLCSIQQERASAGVRGTVKNRHRLIVYTDPRTRLEAKVGSLNNGCSVEAATADRSLQPSGRTFRAIVTRR